MAIQITNITDEPRQRHILLVNDEEITVTLNFHETVEMWTFDVSWRGQTFYGFMLCFAATALATVYHYALGVPAPYPLALHWTALPKWLGTLGGLGLVAGTAGLWRLRRRRHPQHLDPGAKTMDEGFIALLFLTGATGRLFNEFGDEASTRIISGDIDDIVWQGHNPATIVSNLRHTDLRLWAGNGEPGPYDDPAEPNP
mgnify:CR=1 FL=1